MAETPIYIAVIGVGGVGTAFLGQLSNLIPRLPSLQVRRPVRVAAILRSSKALFPSEPAGGIDLSSWSNALSASTTPAPSIEELALRLSSLPGPSILVDNTSAPAVAASYPRFLSLGVSVVTPNKKGFSSEAALWEEISAAVAQPGAGLCRFESAVGAGLPVISTLQDLLATGDEVTRIEGVFSGTMSFLFNSFAPVDESGGAAAKWSATVAEAQRLGFTEPDPRDDLNGLDVARKLTILGRICGVKVEGPTSFPVESLIPKALESAQSGDEFLKGLPQFDDDMEARKAEAKKAGKALRFVGSVDVPARKLKVGLELVDLSGPIAGLKGSDNIISFHTKRYAERPLVVQGAGAGGEVTAMGVTGDLIKVLQRVQDTK